MSRAEPLPGPLVPFLHFTGVLREHGFPIAPEQTMGFVEAIELLGPNRMADVYEAALAMLAPPIERRQEFDVLFRHYFHGRVIEVAAPGADDEDEIRVQDTRDGSMELPDAGDPNYVGGEATAAETLSVRIFTSLSEEQTFVAFSRMAAERLPKRLSRRTVAGRGHGYDLRSSLRKAVRYDGEILRLSVTKRQTTLRGVVLLLDVSGSMKEQTEAMLKFAHALVQIDGSGSGGMEVFTIGTRLTRITPALRIRNRAMALASASGIVADWDGGTRLGEAITAFLAIPRFAGFVRGASVVVVSDGLEQGEPDALERAVSRMSRLAWRVDWLTPLAADKEFEPRTAALQAILPSLDCLGDGSRVQSVCAHALEMANMRKFNPKQGANPRRQWRQHVYGIGNSSSRFR